VLALLLTAGVIAGCGSSSNRSAAYSGNRSAAYGGSSSASSGSGGSGGSSTVTPAAYVKSVCTALGPVVTALRSKQAAVTSATTPSEAKSAFQDYVSTVSTSLGTAIPQVQAAGTPSVSNGSRIESAIVNAFTQLKTALGAAGSQIGSVPTDNAAAFQAGFQSIATNLKSSTAGIKPSLQGLQSPELKSAATAEPACAALKQTS
jgi:hypothetical protein